MSEVTWYPKGFFNDGDWGGTLSGTIPTSQQSVKFYKKLRKAFRKFLKLEKARQRKINFYKELSWEIAENLRQKEK